VEETTVAAATAAAAGCWLKSLKMAKPFNFLG